MIVFAVSCLAAGVLFGVLAVVRWVGGESEERPR